MAFTVFSDAPSAAAPSSALSSRAPPCSSKRALTQQSTNNKLSQHENVAFNGKENYDPFTTLSSKTALKGKAVLAPKAAVLKHSSTTQPRPALASASANAGASTDGIGSGTLVENGSHPGTCTGSLRLRVLPSSLQPQPSPKKAAASRPARTTATAKAKVKPAPLQKRFAAKLIDLSDDEDNLPSPALSFAVSEGKDSGYAGSPKLAKFGDEGADEWSELEEEKEEQKARVRAGRVKKVTLISSPAESVGDRRARALTESPLAELTHAFATQANFSPSPSPLSSAATATATTRSKVSRASPTKLKLTSTATARMRPYVSPRKVTRARAPSDTRVSMRV